MAATGMQSDTIPGEENVEKVSKIRRSGLCYGWTWTNQKTLTILLFAAS